MPRLAFALPLLAVLTTSAAAQSPSALSALRFRELGPANISGRITDLAVVERDPTTFYAASATGGVWRTTNNGVTWRPVWSREAVNSVGCITVDQRDPNIVWIGSGEATNRQSSGWGDGVYKSTDAGRTWSNVGLRDSRHVGRIVVDPRSPDVVSVPAAGHLFGPNAERGLYKTIDGGRTWTRVLFIDDDTGVIDVAVDPEQPDIVYAAAYQRRRTAFGFVGGGPGSALYRSGDAGRTWRKLTAGLPTGIVGRIGISVFRRDPRLVYVSVEQGLRYTASISYEKRLAGVYLSSDRGETWRHMSDWNPRPAYASQIRVDPSDARRVYQMQWSVSDDSGRTWREPRQSLHGDDRTVWVDPRDGRHLIKADDGGVGLSYDRGVTWLYVANLPVSQPYRVRADDAEPYRVYAGFQDNGSWVGPSATYATEGIVNDDWRRTNGGDGFWSVIDTTDGRTLYTNGQYLGLLRYDLVTGDAKRIRPGNPRGEAPKRGNWGAPPPAVGDFTAWANWDAPFVISPHDARTIYAGMKVLWKSADRGEHWDSLGDLSTRVPRRSLPIMGQLPTESTLSLDDGVPYWGTLTALAESPRVPGLLWAGTDDGNLQVSRDGGRTWRNVVAHVPGLPPGTWVADVQPSRAADGTVYAAFDGHRGDDLANHVYRSTDFGQTWTSIAGDLPPNLTVRAIREDPRSPRLLYAGTEQGLWISLDRGARWLAFNQNLPTVPVYDMAFQPRRNDLVLATHGRGLWVLDQLDALQQLAPEVVASPAHLFPMRAARTIRYESEKAHAGDMVFRGENPPDGAIVDLWRGAGADAGANAGADAAPWRLTVHDSTGALVRELPAPTQPGLARVAWDLRYAPLPVVRVDSLEDSTRRVGPRGPLVAPGRYVVRLEGAGRRLEQPLRVDDDPRRRVAPDVRAQWTRDLVAIAALYRAAGAAGAAELRERIAALYQAVAGAVGPLTGEQQAQRAYFARLLAGR